MDKRILADCADEFNELHSNAKKGILEHLSTDERVSVVIRGSWYNSMIATERQVFIYKRGWMSGIFGGDRLSYWNYRHITGISIETGRATSWIALEVPGSQSTDKSWWTGNNSEGRDPAKSTNAIALSSTAYDKARYGIIKIKRFIDMVHGIGTTDSNRNTFNVASISYIDELAKLGQLKEKEIITQEEFESLKKKILDKQS